MRVRASRFAVLIQGLLACQPCPTLEQPQSLDKMNENQHGIKHRCPMRVVTKPGAEGLSLCNRENGKHLHETSALSDGVRVRELLLCGGGPLFVCGAFKDDMVMFWSDQLLARKKTIVRHSCGRAAECSLENCVMWSRVNVARTGSSILLNCRQYLIRIGPCFPEEKRFAAYVSMMLYLDKYRMSWILNGIWLPSFAEGRAHSTL